MQQARERAARRSRTAARNVKDAGLPKIIAGELKRNAQESAGRIDEVHAKRVDDARRDSTRPSAHCATTTSSCSTCPTPTCPPGARWSGSKGVAASRGGRSCSRDVDLTCAAPNASR